MLKFIVRINNFKLLRLFCFAIPKNKITGRRTYNRSRVVKNTFYQHLINIWLTFDQHLIDIWSNLIAIWSTFDQHFIDIHLIFLLSVKWLSVKLNVLQEWQFTFFSIFTKCEDRIPYTLPLLTSLPFYECRK